MNDKLVIENREFYFHPTHKAYAGSIDGCVVHVVTREPTFGSINEKGYYEMTVEDYWNNNNNNNRSLFVATRVKKQTKNKVKDLTSKLGTRMETGRLRRDLLGLRVEQPPGLLFNGLI